MKREVNMRKQPCKKEEQGISKKNIFFDAISTEDEDRIITDPFGSWTGISRDNIYEKPIQDVDDL